MARADLLIKLVESGMIQDKTLFKRVVQSIIAEEGSKQHHVVANRLREILDRSERSQISNQTKGLLNDKLENFLYRSYPKKSFNDIFLSSENRKIIEDLLSEHYRSDLLRSYNLEPRNRILLSGPPGNGKTSLAEVIAQCLMIPFYTVRYDGIIGSYLGETASRLNATFDFIKTQECVLFFDEFDSIGKERGDIHETGEIKRVVSSLLMQIDKLPSYVVVIAATNHPELLDRAVWRRFQVRLELANPDKQLISKWLRHFESKVQYKLQIPITKLAAELVGMNFAEIEEFILDVQRKYILSLPDVDTKQILDESLKAIKTKFSIT